MSKPHIEGQSKEIENQRETIEKLERITQIDKQFLPLVTSGTFVYFPKTKKFVAKDLIGEEIFRPNQEDILPNFKSITIEETSAYPGFLR